MNSEFIWGMIIIVIAIVIIGVAIALYFWWKDRDDYDKEKKIIVWSVAAAGGLMLLFGILFIIWGASKKETIDATKRSLKERLEAQRKAEQRKNVEDYIRSQSISSPPPPKLKPILKSASPKPITTSVVRNPKKVRFAEPGSTS